MFKSEEEIQMVVDDFCKKSNVDNKIFEVSSISKKATGGKDKILKNTTKVKNENCTYVIKYYYALKLFVVWNYRNNHNMKYSLETIKEKLNHGVMRSDKGTGFHPHNQSIVYFSYEQDFENMLHLIAVGII